MCILPGGDGPCPAPDAAASFVLAICIAEPLRQAALGLVPSGPEAAVRYIDGGLDCLRGTMFRWTG